MKEDTTASPSSFLVGEYPRYLNMEGGKKVVEQSAYKVRHVGLTQSRAKDSGIRWHMQ